MTDPLIFPDNKDFPWKEEHLQRHICDWLRVQRDQGKLSYDVGMEGIKLSIGVAVKAKKNGMNKGVPDLKIKLDGGALVHIELKLGKKKVSESQAIEHDLLRSLGHTVHVVRGDTPQEALEKVIAILDLK